MGNSGSNSFISRVKSIIKKAVDFVVNGIDSIPIFSQVKSLIQYIRGDGAGAKATQEIFSKRCVVISQVRSAGEALSGNIPAARQTQAEFFSLNNLATQAGWIAVVFAAHPFAVKLIKYLRGGGDILPISRVDSILVISQIKSLFQACSGDPYGAKVTQVNFSKRCVIVSQLRSAVEACMGDFAAARRTQQEFLSWENLETLGGLIGCAILAPVAGAAAINGLGFGAGGIAAGSAAAGFMASYGGTVPGGSMCSFLQSAGAVGMPIAAKIALTAIGMFVGVYRAFVRPAYGNRESI